MATEYSYIKNEESNKKEAYYVFSSHFGDLEEFEIFYRSIQNDNDKNEFLRIANIYLFMVKNGDWYIKDTGYNKIIEYYSNSYKAITIFSLIESLSDAKHIDFYEWIKDKSVFFPIQNQEKLDELHKEYKKTFGSIRRCVSFFENLSSKTKVKLCESITIKGKSIKNIKKLAELLYHFRSKFVHEGDLILMLDSSPIFDIYKNKLIFSKFSIELMQTAFEEGVMIYFKNKITQPVI